MKPILVLNTGSSSIKFATYEQTGGPSPELTMLAQGQVAQADHQMVRVVKVAGGSLIERSARDSARGTFDHDDALAWMLAWLDEHHGGLTPMAVGHRVVHGGPVYAKPSLVSDAVLRDLDALIPLAPLHQPHSLTTIRIIQARWPDIAQVACFDTAFHSTQPHVAQAFALPRELSDSGVRRYGFHGLSYEYIASQLPRVLGERPRGKVIVAHLGHGASLCALVDGQSVASTMGFSALDGLVMGTRCGTLDPGAVLYLLEQRHLSARDLSALLYTRSGLLGVSGISGDMQVLLASGHPHAAEAIDLFVYRIVGEIGALAAAMGGVDALVFSGGIGEHAAPIRARIAQGCRWLGARLDNTANRAGQALIHAASSQLPLAVVPTNEEKMIADHTLALCRSAR